MTRKCAWVIFPLFLAAIVAFAGDQPMAPEVIELTKLEQAWNDAHVKGDADALDKLWADELVVTVPHMAVMDKAAAIGFWKTGKVKFDTYRTSGVHTKVFGDAAVVTGRLVRTRDKDGKKIEEDWQFTKVYVRRAGKWQVVAWHASESAK